MSRGAGQNGTTPGASGADAGRSGAAYQGNGTTDGSSSARPRFRTLSDADLADLKWRVTWRRRVVDVSRPAEKRWWYVPIDRPERDQYDCLVQLPGNGWTTRAAAVDQLVRLLAGGLGISVPEFYVHLDSARERISRAKEEAA